MSKVLSILKGLAIVIIVLLITGAVVQGYLWFIEDIVRAIHKGLTS